MRDLALIHFLKSQMIYFLHEKKKWSASGLIDVVKKPNHVKRMIWRCFFPTLNIQFPSCHLHAVSMETNFKVPRTAW